MAFDPLTQAELIELWRRLFPPGFTAPIETEADGQGFDLYSQQAAVMSRAAAAANVSTQAYYLKPHSTQTAPPAAGSALATGSVEISRVPPLGGDLVLAQGVQLRAVQLGGRGETILGPVFVLTQAVTMPAGSLGPVTAQIQAARPGYQGNLPPETITAFRQLGAATVTADVIGANTLEDDGTPDRFAGGMVRQFIQITSGANAGTFPRRILGVTQGELTSTITVDGPALTLDAGIAVEVVEYATLGLSIAQPTATVDGVHGFLDAIGEDRRAGRQPGETDTAYRDRLCALEDTISPAAILRIAARALTPLGINFRLKETRDVQGLKGFTWDADPFDFGDISDGRVFVGGCLETRGFVLCVGLGNQGEFGAPYDTPFADNAFDLLFYDGSPLDYLAAIGALYDAIDQARLAGVCFFVVLDPSL